MQTILSRGGGALFHTAVADFLARDNPAAQELVRTAHETVTSRLEKAPFWKEIA